MHGISIKVLCRLSTSITTSPLPPTLPPPSDPCDCIESTWIIQAPLPIENPKLHHMCKVLFTVEGECSQVSHVRMTSPRTFFGPPQSVSGHVPRRGRQAVSCTSTGQVIACAFYFLLPLPPPRSWKQLSKWERRLRKTELHHPAFPVAGTGVELRGSVPAGERTDLELDGRYWF